MTNLLQNCKVIMVTGATAAGTSTINSGIVDMAGFEGVLFMVNFGTPATNNILKAQQNAANSGSGMNDLAGSGLVPGATDGAQALDIFRPQKRYVRVVGTRGTSSTLETIWAIQYNARFRPVANLLAGTILSKSLMEPAEGTP